MFRGLVDVKALNIRRHWDVNVHVALNIHRHWDVKLNELPKDILMLLPLLLLLLLLLYVLYHAFYHVQRQSVNILIYFLAERLSSRVRPMELELRLGVKLE